MSFRTKSDYEVGSAIDLHCKFGAEWVQFRAVVRRAGADNMGVEFVDVQPGVRAKLIDYINMRSAAASA